MRRGHSRLVSPTLSLFLTALILAAIGRAVWPQTAAEQKPDKSVEFKTYTHSIGFSLEYPSSWVLASKDHPDGESERIAAERHLNLDAISIYVGDSVSADFHDNTTVVVTPGHIELNDAAKEGFRQSAELVANHFNSKAEDVTISKETIGGREMLVSRYKWRFQDLLVGQMLFAIPGKAQTYLVTCTAPASRMPEREPLFREMVRRMKIDMGVSKGERFKAFAHSEGFSVEYPESWVLASKDRPDPSTDRLAAQHNVNLDSVALWVCDITDTGDNFIVVTSKGQFVLDEARKVELRKSAEAVARQSNSQAEDITVEPETIGNRMALVSRYSWAVKGVKVSQMMVLIPGRNRAFFVYCTARASRMPAREPLFKELVGRMQIDLYIPGDPVKFKQFTHSKGFSIDYPETWMLASKERPDPESDRLATQGGVNLESVAVFVGDAPSRGSGDNLNVVVIPGRMILNDGVKSELRKMAETVTSQYQAQPENPTIKMETIGDKAGLVSRYSWDVKGTKMSQMTVVIAGKQQAYLVTCTARASRMLMQEALFKEMIKRMKIDLETTK